MAAKSGLFRDAQEPQSDLLRRLAFDRVIPRDVGDLFHHLRAVGNRATHQNEGNHAQALTALKVGRELGIWFHRTFGAQMTNSFCRIASYRLLFFLTIGLSILLLNACAHTADDSDRRMVYESSREGNKKTVTLGCTTPESGLDLVGKDCKMPEDGPACYSVAPNFYIQSSLVVKRVPGHLRGYNPRCYVLPSDYKPYFGQGDVSEPSAICFRVFASGPSGFPPGQTGEVLCEFSIETMNQIVEPAPQ